MFPGGIGYAEVILIAMVAVVLATFLLPRLMDR